MFSKVGFFLICRFHFFRSPFSVVSAVRGLNTLSGELEFSPHCCFFEFKYWFLLALILRVFITFWNVLEHFQIFDIFCCLVRLSPFWQVTYHFNGVERRRNWFYLRFLYKKKLLWFYRLRHRLLAKLNWLYTETWTELLKNMKLLCLNLSACEKSEMWSIISSDQYSFSRALPWHQERCLLA